MNRRIREAMEPYGKEGGLIFESDHPSEGKHAYRYDPRRALRYTLTKAGLSQEDPFQKLRRTFGSILIQKNISILKVTRWMGHSVTVCEKHYAGLMTYDNEINSF